VSIPFIHPPDAPEIAGLCFRTVRGPTDAESLYAVHTRRAAHDGIDFMSTFEDYPSLESLQQALSKVVSLDQQNQWLVAQVSEQVIGYSQLESWLEDDGTRVYLVLGWVVPAWRDRGIGTTMLHWAEETCRQLATSSYPNEVFEFAANASSTEMDTTALLRYEGYQVAYTVLEMNLDPAVPIQMHPVPAGIKVRPVLPEDNFAIASSIGEAYQYEYDQGRYAEAYDPADYAEGLRAEKYDPTLWQIAWDGEQVVGQVLSVIEGLTAEIFEVSVRPSWRRRGLGRALLSRTLQCLLGRGVEDIRLRTVAEFRTRASDLYRSVGFRVLKEFRRYRKKNVSSIF
jgi:mycothiol synthase